MAMACVAAVVITAVVTQQGRAAVAAVIAESRAAAEQSRAANEALRVQLEQVAAAAAPKPIDWKPPLKVQLVRGQKDGPPAAGFKVVLHYVTRPGETRLEPIGEHETGPDGLIDFGPLRPVDYQLNVYTPWEEFHQRSIDHRPGDARIEQIVCPTTRATPEEAEIKISIDWPDDLRDEGLYLICQLEYNHLQRTIAGSRWLTFQMADARAVAHWLVIRANDEARDLVIQSWRDARSFPEIYPFQPNTTGPGGDRGFRVDPKSSHYYFGMEETLPASPNIRWLEGTYRLSGLAVGKEPKELPVDAVRRLEVVALLWRESTSSRRSALRSAGLGPPMLVATPLSQPQFEAIAGAPNLWRIKLPEELLTLVRERLATE
jgi:hypothetical protein